MTILYDLINLFFIIFYLPVFFLKKKMHPEFSMRLGIFPKDRTFGKPVWIHAVSVGEMANMRGLFSILSQNFPDKQFVLSTVTPTGNKIAHSLARKQDSVIYLPVDLSCIVNKALGIINPSLFIIAETEFWPNLITALHRRNVPMIIVNGRISDRSIAGYARVRWLLKPVLRRISLFCMQTRLDADRIISLGADPQSVHVTGNMKFDQSGAFTQDNTGQLKQKMALGTDQKLLVAGSTHPGEEEQVLEAYAKITKQYPSVRLLIAPRHPERAPALEKIVRRFGLEPLRISSLKERSAPGAAVFILDTIGSLRTYYSLADVVFVGGSLIKHGGQNFLEPSFMAKPVIVGPHLFNFRDIAKQFLDEGAFITVHGAEGLCGAVVSLLTDPGRARELVRRASTLISVNQGATKRNADLIKNFAQF